MPADGLLPLGRGRAPRGQDQAGGHVRRGHRWGTGKNDDLLDLCLLLSHDKWSLPFSVAEEGHPSARGQGEGREAQARGQRPHEERELRTGR